MVYVIQICWQLMSRIRTGTNCMTYTTAGCTVKNSWWWTEELSETSKHVEFYSKNKFEKLVHLVGFIIKNLSRCTVTWTSNYFHSQSKFIFWLKTQFPEHSCEAPILEESVETTPPVLSSWAHSVLSSNSAISMIAFCIIRLRSLLLSSECKERNSCST